MATFFINDTGVVTTASTGADSIYIQSAAVVGGEILGLAGNDTINLTEGVAANTSAIGIAVKGGAGNDLITVSAALSFSAGQHTLIGGAGNDTITISGTRLDQLKGNAGADVVNISGAKTISSIGLGAGSDTITIGKFSDTTVTRLSLGDGHDLISAGSTISFATAASVIGGAGKDTIQLTVAAAGQASAYINGGGLADLISADGLEGNSTVKGMGGGDTITLSGDAGTTAFIAAGAGADVVNYSGLNVGSTIAGGSGNDSIAIMDNITTVSALVLGGSDANSISFNEIAGTNDYSKVTVKGGLGADTITFSAGAIDSGASVTTYGTLTYSSFSESNLAGQDLLKINSVLTSGGLTTQQKFTVDFADSLSSVSVSEAVGAVTLSDATFSGNIAASVLTVSGNTYNVSSTTALAGTVDSLTLAGGKGAAVLVSAKGGNNFLFVQGGTTGTADDSVISLGTLSGEAISFSNGNAVFTMSGTSS
jgi:hypothetical protein